MGLTTEAVGRALGELRKARGITQRELAAETGLTINFLSLVERGQRGVSMDVINRLADPLGVPPEMILFLAGERRSDGKTGPFDKLREVTKKAILKLVAAESEG